jgi:hypothetical protein
MRDILISESEGMEMVGMLKSKCTVYCEVCGSSQARNLSVKTENTPEAINEAKEEIKQRASKPYTCRVCLSILKSVS